MLDDNLINEAKRVSVEDVLERAGVKFTRKDRQYTIKSPLREDSTPSFAIYKKTNTWYDYGTNKGGDSIALYMEIYHCNFPTAVRALTGHPGDPIYHYSKEVTTINQVTSNDRLIQVIDVKKLSRPELIQWATVTRRIPYGILDDWCQEVFYKVGGKGPFFAIGFANDDGGYALRSAPTSHNPKGYKMTTNAQISTIRLRPGEINKDCLVFEGFFNFLSWIVLSCGMPPCDAIILNSVINVKRLYGIASTGVKTLHCYLDNDSAGKNALLDISDHSGCKVCDYSYLYANKALNDLNEYLQHETVTV